VILDSTRENMENLRVATNTKQNDFNSIEEEEIFEVTVKKKKKNKEIKTGGVIKIHGCKSDNSHNRL